MGIDRAAAAAAVVTGGAGVVVAFLASPSAGYVTGTISVSGGLTMV